MGPPHLKVDARVTKNIIRAMVPRPDVSLVITFYFEETTNDRTFLFPPILRREVLDQQSVDGDHILVYLTSGFESLLDRVEALPARVVSCLRLRPVGPRGNNGLQAIQQRRFSP